MYTRIPTSHNRRTKAPQAVFSRSYSVPTAWTPPPAKGLRQGATATINYYYAPTPPKGHGNPRLSGQRIVNQRLRTTNFVG